MSEIQRLKREVYSLRKQLREMSPPCAFCGEKTAGWEPPFGSFAPEAWETLRERGINAATGHKVNCRRPAP